jgi:hypothetical protein
MTSNNTNTLNTYSLWLEIKVFELDGVGDDLAADQKIYLETYIQFLLSKFTKKKTL